MRESEYSEPVVDDNQVVAESDHVGRISRQIFVEHLVYFSFEVQ